jgi:hypothetical protein
MNIHTHTTERLNQKSLTETLKGSNYVKTEQHTCE